VTDRTTRADTALNTVWRNEDDGRAVLLKITPEGLAAIGVEPVAEPAPAVEPSAAELAGAAVDYRFNEGTNSAGKPAAGAAAPAEASKKRGRPKKAAQPTDPAPTARKRGRARTVAAETAATPARARLATTPSRRS